MYCGNLISMDVPVTGPADTVADVQRQLEAFRLRQLPVADGERFMGMIAEDDLLDEAEKTTLSTLQDSFLPSRVQSGDHFLLAAKLSHLMDLDIVPVLNDKQELEGVITRETLFRELARLTGVADYGSLLVLDMERSQYSPGEINRLVESNDAFITQLNTVTDPESGLLTVVLRINKEEVSDIVAGFQRHGYTVRYYVGEEHFQNELQANLDHLMNYLNI